MDMPTRASHPAGGGPRRARGARLSGALALTLAVVSGPPAGWADGVMLIQAGAFHLGGPGRTMRR